MIEQVGNPLFFKGLFVDASTRQGMSGITVAASMFRFTKSTGAMASILHTPTIAEMGSTGYYWTTLPESHVTVEGDYFTVFTTTAAAFYRVAVDQVTVGRGVKLLGTKDFDELPQATVPPAKPKLEQLLMLLYMAVRDKTETSSSGWTLYNDDGLVVARAPLSDNGSSMIRSEMVYP